MDTIKVPSNLGLLADRLPKPDYEDLPTELLAPPRRHIASAPSKQSDQIKTYNAIQ